MDFLASGLDDNNGRLVPYAEHQFPLRVAEPYNRF